MKPSKHKELQQRNRLGTVSRKTNGDINQFNRAKPHPYFWRKLYTTKTYLYILAPLKPHFYMVKDGFTRINIIFPISAKKAQIMRTR